MNLTKPTKVVSVMDPSIDYVSMGEDAIKEYIETRNSELVKTMPGMKPTIFYVRSIPASVYQTYVAEAPNERAIAYRAFQMGVTRVEHITTMDGETREAIEPTGERQVPRGHMKFWLDHELEAIPNPFIEEIGHVANQLSRLVPGNELAFRLPPSLLQDWAARMIKVLQAAVDRETARRSTSEKRKAPRAKKRSRSGAKRTDATATAKATD